MTKELEVKDNKLPLVSQGEAEDFIEGVERFSDEIRKRTEELKETDNKEVVVIEDSKQGLAIQLHSKKFSPIDLSNIAIQLIDLLLMRRTNRTPTGV